MSFRDDLKADLRSDEGKRLKPYKCTAGKTTIGIGRNLDDVGISDEEAEFLLDNDVNKVLRGLDERFPWFNSLPDRQKRALSNMDFQLGLEGVSKFRGMLAALAEKRFHDAAEAALDSLWARQTPDRAKRVADLMRS